MQDHEEERADGPTSLVCAARGSPAESLLRRTNAVLEVVRRVGRVVARERDEHRLIEHTCESLVSCGVFSSAWIWLRGRDEALPRLAYAKSGSGQSRSIVSGHSVPLPCSILDAEGVLLGPSLETRCGACEASVACFPGPRVVASLGERGILGVDSELVGAFEDESLVRDLAMAISLGLDSIEHERRRKRAEVQLWGSEERYHRLTNGLRNTHAVIACDPNGTIAFASSGFGNVFGVEAGDAQGRNWRELGIVAETDVGRGIVDPLLGCEEGDTRQFVCVRPDGSRRTVEFLRTSARDCNGREIIETVCSDVTERARASEFVSLRLKLFEYATNHSLGELLRLTLDEVERLTGSQIAFYHFLAKDQRTISLQAWSTRTASKYCRIVGPDVHYVIEQAGVWVDCVRERRPIVHNDYAALPHRKGMPKGHAALVRELVVPVFRHGEIVAILGVGNKPSDYTEVDVETLSYVADVAWAIVEQKRNQEEIHHSHEVLSSFVRHSPVYAYIKDVESDKSRIIVASDNCKEMVGVSGSELTHRTMEELFPLEFARKITEDDAYVVSRGETLEIDEELNGRSFTSIKFPITLGEKTYLAGYTIDITERLRAERERRELEARLAQSDRMASLGMVAAGVAHEINNPLSYVLCNLSTLAEDLPRVAVAIRRCYEELVSSRGEAGATAAPRGEAGATAAPRGNLEVLQPQFLEDLLDRVRECHSGAERIKAIARSLGTFSRADRTQLEPVDLQSTVEQAIVMASNELRFRARLVKVFDPVPRVLGNDGKLVQVFLNLLVNAAHSIEEGHVKDNEVRVRIWNEENWVLAEVRDTGAGIAEENAEKIFDPFFTTKAVGVGTGLGLAICRKIISELRGEISFTSHTGDGTSFVVKLPRATENGAKERAGAREHDVPVPALSGRILVIDDEEGVRGAIVRTLERDHSLVTVASGEEARVLLERDNAFDVVLCDLMMPKMSGMELHSWLLQHQPDLAQKVVFVTGGAFTPGATEYLATIPNLRIEKPFVPGELNRIVRERVHATKATAH